MDSMDVCRCDESRVGARLFTYILYSLCWQVSTMIPHAAGAGRRVWLSIPDRGGPLRQSNGRNQDRVNDIKKKKKILERKKKKVVLSISVTDVYVEWDKCECEEWAIEQYLRHDGHSVSGAERRPAPVRARRHPRGNGDRQQVSLRNFPGCKYKPKRISNFLCSSGDRWAILES